METHCHLRYKKRASERDRKNTEGEKRETKRGKTRRNRRGNVSKRGRWERWPCVLVYPGQSQLWCYPRVIMSRVPFHFQKVLVWMIHYTAVDIGQYLSLPSTQFSVLIFHLSLMPSWPQPLGNLLGNINSEAYISRQTRAFCSHLFQELGSPPSAS